MKQTGDGNNYPSKPARNLINQLGGSDELDGYFADISSRENANLSFGQVFFINGQNCLMLESPLQFCQGMHK
jgi:[histone H3]-lysine4 N-trimethyltransferase ATXR3